MRVSGATFLAGVLILSMSSLVPAVLADGPSVTIDSHGEGEVVDGEIVLAGTVSSDTGLRGVRVRVDSGDWSFATVTGSGPDHGWTHTLDTTVLTNGGHLVEAEANDAGGLASSVTVRLVVDNPIYHDLSVVRIAGPQGPVGGISGADVTVTVANNGNLDSPALPLTLAYEYFDAWHEIDRRQVVVAEGETLEVEMRWETTIKFGEFRVRAVVDPDNVLPEQDEENNVAEGSVVLYTDGGGILGASDPFYPMQPDPYHRQLKLVQILGQEDDAAFVSPVQFVRVGDLVQWWNGDDAGATHQVRADDGSFDTGLIEVQTYTQPIYFDEPGTYRYHDVLYPDNFGYIVAVDS